MSKFGFAAARPEESIVYGSQRPGYGAKSVAAVVVDDWIAFMKQQGISRICCLLDSDQLTYYNDLLGQYQNAFGESNVRSAPVKDYHLCDQQALDNMILPFLVEAEANAARVLVHCSGGVGRTGHVLVAWLVRGRGMQPDAAIEAVKRSGRNPLEAVESGRATKDQLYKLLAGVRGTLGESGMTDIDRLKMDQLVGKLRASHDELEHLIKSNPKEALRLLDRARYELFDLVEAYEKRLNQTQ